jgi:hypothetical protein
VKLKKKDPVWLPRDVLTPRSQIMTELNRTAKQAVALEKAMELWLLYKNGDPVAARQDPMIPNVPPSFVDAKIYNKATKDSGLFERHSFSWPKIFTKSGKHRGSQALRASAIPSLMRTSDWPTIFDYWLSGGLSRGIETLIETLTKEQAQAVLELTYD